MGPRNTRIIAACAAVLGGLAPLAGAQSTRWLRIEGVGTPGVHPALVQTDASGQSQGVADWLADASWAHGLSDFASHNYTALSAASGPAPDAAAVWTDLPPADLIHPGRVTLFGVQMQDRIVTLTPEEFGLLAARAGVAWEPAEGQHRIVVRRIEGAKVLLRTPDQAGAGDDQAGAVPLPVPSGVPTTKRGERAEIRPLMDPTTCTGGEPGGGVLPVRVYAEGEAVPGAVVIATHLATGTEQRVVARQFGIADLQIDREGAWRIEFTMLYPVPHDQEAAWVAYTATLAFETAWSDQAEEANASSGGGAR